ncbi:la-related protein 7-like [Actinia tenebrosa]|uniref:La-related protein 7 n=1 Tax=Actinia tenebrosa TaxID=6105 RepID=A0A6P8I3U9_ACTTE|nr:la-related protein 7-like [Actinia tenebrosa]XP_031559597.1 la-related protein 7-like [Actinia tenebrosa]
MASGTKHDKRQSCQENKDTENSQKKKHKKRTKKIESQLKDQIEFYFSDSNLQKDRFLKQAISKNPNGYISVKTIADFNRMKQITKDITLVIKAIKSSSLLQLNDDESMVRRTTPLPEARNVDAETIYVEKLPPHADHDWLRNVFSQFGKVTYVSLPRFKHTGDIKGFAFIEFETPNEADTAVQTFKKEKEEKENGQDEEQAKPKRRKRSQSESDADDKQPYKTERKRRRTISESSADSHDSSSRIEKLQLKKEQPTDLAGSHSKVEVETARKEDDSLEEGKGTTRKRKKSDKAVHWEHEDTDKKDKATGEVREESEEERPSKRARSSESESYAENTDEEQSKKKKKKRKRKAMEKKESKLPLLRVISKLEWLRLKQEYKQLQRQSMQELKKQLQECHEGEVDHNKEETSHQGKKTTKGKETNKETAKGAPEELPFTTGVVLHFKSSDTELQKKDIRDKLAAHAPVAYIDLADGSGEGYVRFHTPDNCTAVLDGMSDDSSGLQLVKLTGQEERDYWKKINADRVARFQAKREKKRGIEKVARKADALQAHQQITHIRFDDD